jgi:hypothetical protein
MCVCTQVYELQSQVQDAHAQLMHQHHQLEMAASVEQQKQQVLADAARAREEGALVGNLFGSSTRVYSEKSHFGRTVYVCLCICFMGACVLEQAR